MHNESSSSRRRFLKLGTGGLMFIPLVNLAGCSEEATPPAEAPKPAAAPAPSVMTPAESSPPPQAAPAAAAGELVKLQESDPTAQTLGYRHAAETVDKAKYARYEAGQKCGNCNLYQPAGSPEPEWGACSIFPGKLVNSAGWCNVYVPKA